VSEEKARILQMVRDGKITTEDGLELLSALDETEGRVPRPPKGIQDRFLRVRVDSTETKVNVNFPLSLLKVASNLVNMGVSFVPDEARREMEAKGLDITKIDFEDLVNLINQGLVDGKLVDVDTEDPEHGRTRVEVYVE
jgi:hypothetical protein